MNAGRHATIKTALDEALETRRHLNDAIEIYRNGYDDNRNSAIEAIAAGRAAFWSTSSYSSARTVDLPLALNRGVSIADALAEAFPNWRATYREAALETIVPLNGRAANALALAYARFGSWREDEELLMRCLRDTRPSIKREPLTYDNYLKSREAM